jgi:hypothetical protein
MRIQATLNAVACCLLGAATVTAFPWMAEGTYPGQSHFLDVSRAWTDVLIPTENEPKVAKRQGFTGLSDLLPNTVNSLLGPGGLLQGLATAGASAVNPNDKVPDAAHPFKVGFVVIAERRELMCCWQAPGKTDQRGPCPGLNALGKFRS